MKDVLFLYTTIIRYTEIMLHYAISLFILLAKILDNPYACQKAREGNSLITRKKSPWNQK